MPNSDVENKAAARFDVVEYVAGKPGFQNASGYDQRRFGGPASNYKQTVMMNAIMRLAGPLEGKRVLDVGCGTGRGVVRFAPRATFTVGSDFSLDMLSHALQKTAGNPNCGFVRSVAQQLPFPDASFDVVTALNFLHLFRVETQWAMIAEMKRVARPGGTVVLEFDNALHGLVVGPYKRWFRDERGSLPAEIRRAIGGDCRIVKVYGAVVPIAWRVMYRFPRLFVPLERIGYFPPFNHLLHRIYCKVIPDGPARNPKS
jgi:ubiquinone/menaquinone biosynthesis C-methylase UbiE